MNTNDQTITNVVERLTAELDRAHAELAAMADQLSDVRSERDEEHQRADAEHQFVVALQTFQASNEAFNKTVGFIAARAGVSWDEGKAKLKSRSASTGEKMKDIVARIIAGQAQADLAPGDPEVAGLLAAAGVPLEFWNALTLDGAIFEDYRK